MQDFPHHYEICADGGVDGPINVAGESLETLPTTSPPEFGGPEGYWSPETMLVASVANCFILTFRAIAQASRFEWNYINCSVDGILDRVDRKIRFTQYRIKTSLHLPAGGDEARARKLLDKVSANCLIINSLNGIEQLDVTVLIAE